MGSCLSKVYLSESEPTNLTWVQTDFFIHIVLTLDSNEEYAWLS